MPHGYVSMLAVNKSGHKPIKDMYEQLGAYCGDRISHDAFYSRHGIEKLCHEQRCTMRDIVVEEVTYEELVSDSLEAISE